MDFEGERVIGPFPLIVGGTPERGLCTIASTRVARSASSGSPKRTSRFTSGRWMALAAAGGGTVRVDLLVQLPPGRQMHA